MYYLYRHIRLDKNEPFYIGIGRKRSNRCFQSYRYEFERAHCTFRNEIWKRITNKSLYEVEILLESSCEFFIKEKEKEFIKLYGRIDLGTGTLANMTDGGEGIPNPSKETRDKISKRLTGISRSDYTKKLLSEINKGSKGRKHSDKSKSIISFKNKGVKNGMYGKHGVDNKKSKKVFQFDKNGIFIREWVNAREVNEKLGFSYKDISACCTNKQYTAHGFIWKFTCTI